MAKRRVTLDSPSGGQHAVRGGRGERRCRRFRLGGDRRRCGDGGVGVGERPPPGSPALRRFGTPSHQRLVRRPDVRVVPRRLAHDAGLWSGACGGVGVGRGGSETPSGRKPGCWQLGRRWPAWRPPCSGCDIGGAPPRSTRPSPRRRPLHDGPKRPDAETENRVLLGGGNLRSTPVYVREPKRLSGEGPVWAAFPS